ncbi:MAG: HNH endonuclease [Candidatus Coatesbacteria bacterium]
MRADVRITDFEWYKALKSLSGLDEVNFWLPGGKQGFGAVALGELVLFKLHAPHNAIVGGGVFTHFTFLPVDLAWEAFETKNGARSLEEMKTRIAHYRGGSANSRENYIIGNVILSNPFFLDEARWIPAPRDWKQGTQKDKTYDLSTGVGREIWDALVASSATIPAIGGVPPGQSPRYGPPTIIEPRMGQGGFRFRVADAYGRRCALSGERVLPALVAAHIRPYKNDGPHDVKNGLLLRSDIHVLFDKGYITVTPDHHVEISKRLKTEFGNGRDYLRHHGSAIQLPGLPSLHPAAEYLRWHNERVYVG